jgi:hypothetical protein
MRMAVMPRVFIAQNDFEDAVLVVLKNKKKFNF